MKSLNYALLASLCALAVGILLVVWPDMAINYLVITVGVLFLIPGLAGVFSYCVDEVKLGRAYTIRFKGPYGKSVYLTGYFGNLPLGDVHIKAS